MSKKMVRLGDIHLLTYNAECMRPGSVGEHHHRCSCGEFHEPLPEESSMIYRAAKNPGDACPGSKPDGSMAWGDRDRALISAWLRLDRDLAEASPDCTSDLYMWGCPDCGWKSGR